MSTDHHQNALFHVCEGDFHFDSQFSHMAMSRSMPSVGSLFIQKPGGKTKANNPLFSAATTCDCHERTFCYAGISGTGP